MLKTHTHFQFFRNAIEHDARDKFFERLGDASKDLIMNFAITAGVSLLILVVFLIWRSYELEWSEREADAWFAFFVLLTMVAFLPFHFQAKFGSIRSVMWQEWSEQEGRYLKPPISTPAMLVDRWCKEKGFLVFQSGVILLNLCIIIALFGIVGIVLSWTAPRTSRSSSEEEAHELQTISPLSQPVPSAQPVGQEQLATPRIIDRYGSQNTSLPQRSPFDDSNVITRPQRPARVPHHPESNPFDDSNEIEEYRRDAPPTYHSAT
ncbi:MAG: hypothetical protein Q9165_000460 [Trypethelium subeluteriae]